MTKQEYWNRCKSLKGVAGRPVKHINKEIIYQIYLHGGSTRNKKELSRLHGFSLATFYRRLSKFKLKQAVCDT